MSKKLKKILSAVLLFALTAVMATGVFVGCGDSDNSEKISDDPVLLDFYVTLGTMPTLYATLNAYQNQNPHTYMWFYRGNTISYDYSADFIHYFDQQSKTNAYSEIDYMAIRNKVRELKAQYPNGKFRLFCDDIRVRFIPDIFVAAGVDFRNLDVTLLSDGTGTYDLYKNLTEDGYSAQASEWAAILKDYTDNRSNAEYTKYADDFNNQALELQEYAFYISTFDNVKYWIQHPDYLINSSSPSVNAARENMNVIKKDPKAMYDCLDTEIGTDYRKAVLANALVDSDTLQTLDDAVAYFDGKLSGKDKDVVLILGTSYDGLEHNKDYIDSTIAYYTPMLKENDATKAVYKNAEYDVSDGNIDVNGKTLKVGEIAAYLYFKGHPAHPANEALQAYFAQNNIEILPHRTPVETLFWMYDVKAGGYNSTSFLSCKQGQAEFFYGEPSGAVATMKGFGFFDNAVVF